MAQGLLPLASGATTRRRGRPPGAKSKRSLDLGKYIEAHYGGLTPGQQAAAICLPTPREVREAKRHAAELGIKDLGLSPELLALVIKATYLAAALDISIAGAWSAMHAERKELMAYVHQKQAPKAEAKDEDRTPIAYLIPDDSAGGQLADFSDPDEQVIEFIEGDPAAA